MYRRDGNSFNQCGVGENASGEWKNAKGRLLDPDGLFWCKMVADA